MLEMICECNSINMCFSSVFTWGLRLLIVKNFDQFLIFDTLFFIVTAIKDT